MHRLKKFRKGCPLVVTVIIDHKCFALVKRHSREWWRRWWRHHRKWWWRHHKGCIFMLFLFSLWNFCVWTLVISLLCCLCCRRKCERRINCYVE